MAARPKARAKAPAAEPESGLLAALKHVGLIAKQIGMHYDVHCVLANRWAIANNGVIALGMRIAEDILIAPHTLKLIGALERCNDNIAITQLASGVSIKSGAFRVNVPTIEPALIPFCEPDRAVAVADDRLRAGFAVLGPLAADGAPFVATASILLQAGSMLATDRVALMEYWHGIDLPPALAVPKAAISIIEKIKRPITGFGYTPGNSVTFWFGEDAWLKAQLYNDAWPIERSLQVLNNGAHALPIPATLREALQAVMPHAENSVVHCLTGKLATSIVDGIGATYEVEGLPGGATFNGERLNDVLAYASTMDIVGTKGVSHFFGENLRGVLCQISNGETQ